MQAISPTQLYNVFVDMISASDLQTAYTLVLTKMGAVMGKMVRGVQQGWVPHDLDCDGSQVAGIKGLLQRAHLIQHTSNGPYISLAIVRLTLQVVDRGWTEGRQVVDRGYTEDRQRLDRGYREVKHVVDIGYREVGQRVDGL